MELDDAYANGAYIPGATEFPARWAAQAAAFRDAHRQTRILPYGPSARQVMDLFLPDATPKGTVIFVHGGYWRSFDKSTWSHLAAGPLTRGWAVAIPSYDLCPDARIPDITQQIARAIDEVSKMVRGPLRLAGHSAGGHLVARMIDDRVPHGWSNKVEAVMPISPLGDLRPLLQTTMNDDLQLNEITAIAESPILQTPPVVPVTIWVGADERPAFIAQAQSLGQTWKCDCVIEPDKHHFDVIDGLADPDSPMMQRLMQ